MPKDFWAEAVACSMHISKCSPTKILKDVITHEAWSEERSNVSNFWIFGSIAYVDVPQQERIKLDDRRKKFVLIGYDESFKCYK